MVQVELTMVRFPPEPPSGSTRLVPSSARELRILALADVESKISNPSKNFSYQNLKVAV